MQADNVTFLQALRFKNCELWNSKNSDMHLDAVSDLQIIYSQPLDQFILRIHNLRLILDKSIQVLGSIVGRHQRQAFFLASRDGFSMIKLIDYSQSSPALHNLETIFEATTSFSRKWGLDPILASFTERHDSSLKESFVSALGAVSKVFGKSSDFDSHPNQKYERSLAELKELDSHGSPVVDMPRSELADLKEKLEKDSSEYQNNSTWGRFFGREVQSQQKSSNNYQNTEQISQLDTSENGGEKIELSKTKGDLQTCKFHPSSDAQEVVGAQEQRLPSYEVQHGKEHKESGLTQASDNLQQGEDKVQLPIPEDIEDESFTTGLLSRNAKEATNLSGGKDFPVTSDDAFSDLTHPMRKYSAIDRPFLNEDYISIDNTQSQGGFTSQPFISAGGRTNLRSDIDEQPSPISNTEKYKSDVSQPEISQFGQENLRRETSQGNETKNKKRAANQPIDKENLQQETNAI